MSTTVTYPALPCALCYLESARRVAKAHPDPLIGESIKRTAETRYRAGTGMSFFSADTHSRHPRRLTPWPSDKPAAA
jgi:hypothetical protein